MSRESCLHPLRSGCLSCSAPGRIGQLPDSGAPNAEHRDPAPSAGMSLADAVHHVTTTNPLYALTTAEIRGQSYRVFSNIPQTMRALLQHGHGLQDDGRAEFLVFRHERMSYDEFCRDVSRMADVLLTRMQLSHGQRIGVAMRNCPEMLVLMMAITAAGGVVTFFNAWWTTEELDYAIGDSGVTTIFADGARVERIAPLVDARGLTLIGVRDGEDLAVESYSTLKASAVTEAWPNVPLETDDDMAVMYSSGTTGHPKGVVLTHRGAVTSVYTWLMQPEVAKLVTPPEPDAPAPLRPCCLIITPLFHVTATHPMFLLGLAAGAKIVLMDKWDADLAVDLIERETVTRVLGVPTQTADLIEAAARKNASLDTVDFLGSGGAKRPAAQVGVLAERFPKAQVATGWGMTETNANGIGHAGPAYVAQPGTAGRLYPPVQDLRFLDADGREVPQGEIGEITVRSASNMRCYLNKPEATAEVLKDGWLRTGDLGFIDADGIITIVDRAKNIIIRGGENIACLDVEGAIHRHPDVLEACAFTIPDDRLGEIVGAGVRLRDGADLTQEALAGFLKGHIAQYKIPARVWFRTTPLPRGATDKLDRRGLRQACLADADTPT